MTADLRPEELRGDGATVVREVRGRDLLRRAIDLSGGQAAWDQFGSAEMCMTDEWRGWVGWLFRPWPGNPTRMQMRFELGMRDARSTFLSTPRRGEIWGRDGDRTWTQTVGAERVFCQRESVRFILSAYQYFFELPVRIAEAPLVFAAGSREREGRRYSLVFATWGALEPHQQHDQYLLWIAEDTGLIEIAQYTIRDKFRFAMGVIFFSEFRDTCGMHIPHAYRIAQKLDDATFVHRVRLADVHFSPVGQSDSCEHELP